MSSQDSIEQPPLKKQKHNTSQSSEVPKEEQFQFSQSFKSSETLTNSNHKSIIIKKGDKIQKRVSQLLKLATAANGQGEGECVFLMSSGEGLQKMISIIEIFKMKLAEIKDLKFEQFNKLDHYETVVRKNEILDKTIKVPVFYSLIRKQGDDVNDEFSDWTRQEI